MISAISFYLLNPKTSDLTPLYVSLSDRTAGERIRFSTGRSVIAKYCNVRSKKGGKDLVKKNTPFTLTYATAINDITLKFMQIESDIFREHGKCSIQDVRDKYELLTGVTKMAPTDFAFLWDNFVKESRSGWTLGFAKVISGVCQHLEAFQTYTGKQIEIKTFSEKDWKAFSAYLVSKELNNSTSNKILKRFRQFLRHAAKAGQFDAVAEFNSWPLLKQIKTFKIALKEAEIAAIIALNFTDSESRLDKARDLFLLEIFTGQRYSDLNSVLDRKNYDDEYIRIYQQKTNESIAIPRHTQLDSHLADIFKKYPKGFPVMTNQRFNEYLKLIGDAAGIKQVHQWKTMSGTKKTTHTAPRFDLITTHTGRRTFATIAIKRGIPSDIVMKVTGHKSIAQFIEYIKIDDEDVREAFAEKF